MPTTGTTSKPKRISEFRFYRNDGDEGTVECPTCLHIFNFDVHSEEGLTDERYPPLILKCPKCGKVDDGKPA